MQISAQSPGLVVAVGAMAGQRMRKGELLVQLDDAEARAAVAQAQATVDQAAARVDQLRRVGAIVASEALRQAQAQLDSAQRAFSRAEQLASGGAISPAELDEAQRTLDVARAQKTAAEAQQLAAAPLGADSRVALTALLQARAQLAGANVRLAQMCLSAVDDGVVLSRSVEPGDVVQPGKVLLVMALDADGPSCCATWSGTRASWRPRRSSQVPGMPSAPTPRARSSCAGSTRSASSPSSTSVRSWWPVALTSRAGALPSVWPWPPIWGPPSATSCGSAAVRQWTTWSRSPLFRLGNEAIDRSWLITSLRHAQALFSLPAGATAIDLKIGDVFAAERVAGELRGSTGLDADSWMKLNAELLSGLSAQSSSKNMIQFFVVVAVALGIASVLIVSVVQKSREIGILRAVGTPARRVLRIFLIQGGVLGLAGSFIGAALGTAFAQLFEGMARNPDGSARFAVTVDAELLAFATLLATGIGLLAAVIPARRAAKLDPATALRNMALARCRRSRSASYNLKLRHFAK